MLLALGNMCWPLQLGHMQDCGAYILSLPFSCPPKMCYVSCAYAVHIYLDSQQAAAEAMH